MKLLIKNIKNLVQTRDDRGLAKVAGKEMKQLPCIQDAYLAIENDCIVDFGKMEDWPGISDWTNLQVIDASNKLVFPSWCDSHTHLVYAGTREGEFVDRIIGLTYEEIANRGGGILNSAKKLHAASEEELLQSALLRLKEVVRMGTGAIEIKSGYGLSVEDELKMLRVIKKLQSLTPVTIKATFLLAAGISICMTKREITMTSEGGSMKLDKLPFLKSRVTVTSMPLNFASKVAAPYEVGRALGAIATNEMESSILPFLLNSEDETSVRFVAGFIWARFWKLKTEWVDAVLDRAWFPENQSKFLTLLPFEEAICERVSSHLTASH